MEEQSCQRQELSEENTLLRERICGLEAQNKQLAEEVRWLKELFLRARHAKYGTKSERTVDTGILFNEAEVILSSSKLTEETITYTRRKKKAGHREEVVSGLEVETIEHRVPEEKQACPCCGGRMHEMSVKTRDELAIIPAQVKIVRHIRHVYACRNCDRNETSTPIITADAPRPIIEKSLASPSAIAQIMGMKYVEAMPLYRIEKHFEQFGIELPRAVLSNWMIKGGEILEPIYNCLKEELLRGSALHADETVLQVLKEDGRKAQSNSYMWLYRSGSPGPPVVLYEYQPTRSGDHPHRFLAGYKGYLHVDGYAGYNGIPGVTLVGCWAHARRKFVEAQKLLPKEERENPKHLVNIAIRQIGALFRIEEELKDANPEARKAAREEKSRPLVREFKAWLDQQAMKALPKSGLGQAIHYCEGQWPKLEAYLSDGRLEISNNRAERSIKPFVIGRKNWLFANTARGAKTSAVIYSIVETAKENGLNPYAYLERVLEETRSVGSGRELSLERLLPWSEWSKACQVKP